MSIQSELTRIANNVSESVTALEELGVTATSSDDIAAGIRAIPRAEIVQETGGDTAAVMSQAAVTAELSRLSSDKVDKSGLTLGYHTDGLIYIFAGTTPLGTGIELPAGGDVVGFVDSANNIVVKGNLADGTYTVKYEMEDGSVIDIGNLVLDTNVYYSVTKNLTNCTIDNSDTQVVEGEAYTATITANSGYELSSVVVTMGGNAVTVNDGVINIAAVSGNIVITAVAEESGTAYTNLLPLAVDADGNDYVGTNGEDGYKTGYKMSTSSGNESETSGAYCSGFMPVGYGEEVYIKNITLHSGANVNNVVFYDANKAKVIGAAGGTAGQFNSGVNYEDGVYHTSSDVFATRTDIAFFRFSCGGITGETIVTVNEEIV